MAGAAAAAAVAVHAAYARQYFFLFDDFALVGQASEFSIRQIFGKSLFAFYRPIVFLSIKAESAVFGGGPAGHMAVTAALHLVNASLVFAILRRFAAGAFAALCGAALFAASPWASEAIFWLSGRFDVTSAFGVLVCVTAVATDAESRARRAVLTLAALSGAAIALLAKENAVVVLPVALVLACAARGGVRRVIAWWPCWTGVIVMEAIYLFVRGRLLPGLGGAYGTAASLFGHSPIAGNALGYVRAFVTTPQPWTKPGVEGATAVVVAIVAGLGLITALAWLAHRRLVVLALAGFAAAIAPTLWMQPGWFATQAGRFMYLPGVFGCVIAAAAIDTLARRGAAARIASIVFAGALFTWSLCSCVYQARWWSQASALSRTAIEQFRPLAASGGPAVFVPNLPFWFDGGPYVLKDYAFGYYFPGAPTVRTRNVVLEREGSGTRFASWIDGGGVPEPSPVRRAPGERVLVLTPVIRATPLAEIHPPQLSLFSTLDARRASEAAVAVSTPIAWRAESSDPSLFGVAVTRGSGDALLRLVPVARDATVDRIGEVILRSDDEDGVVLARSAVRVRVMPAFASGPPFGSVDVPPAPGLSAATPGPWMFEGWALDAFSLRRVSGEAVDANGRRVPLGEAVRDGERPDVSKVFPSAHDLYNARWVLRIDPSAMAPLARPVTVEIYAENGDGTRALIGTRSIY